MTRRGWACFALVLVSCGGGVGTPAPAGVYPDAPSACDDEEELLADTTAAAEDGVLDDLAGHVEELLVEQRGLIPLVRTARHVTEAVGTDALLGLSAGWADGEGIGRLTGHLEQVLLYIRGQSPHVAGSHEAVVEVLHRVLASQGAACDSLETLQTIQALAEAEHPRGGPWIQALYDDVRDLAEDEAFVALLGDLTYDEEGGNDLAVGREAFVLIANLVIGYVAAPDFDPDVVRDLLSDVLVSQFAIEPETEARVERLLDTLDVVTAVDAPTQAGVQALLGCARSADPDGIVAGMVYDYVQIEALSLPGFLRDLEAFADGPAGEALRLLFVDAIPALTAEGETTTDALSVLGGFIEPERRAAVLDAFLALKGRGVALEVFDTAARLSRGCGEGG